MLGWMKRSMKWRSCTWGWRTRCIPKSLPPGLLQCPDSANLQIGIRSGNHLFPYNFPEKRNEIETGHGGEASCKGYAQYLDLPPFRRSNYWAFFRNKFDESSELRTILVLYLLHYFLKLMNAKETTIHTSKADVEISQDLAKIMIKKWWSSGLHLGILHDERHLPKWT